MELWLIVLVAVVALVASTVATGMLSSRATRQMGHPDGAKVARLESENAQLRQQLKAALDGRPALPPVPAEGGTWPVRPSLEETINILGRPLPSALVREIDDMRDKPIAAVKHLRERTGLGLKDAKDVVDAIRAGRY